MSAAWPAYPSTLTLTEIERRAHANGDTHSAGLLQRAEDQAQDAAADEVQDLTQQVDALRLEVAELRLEVAELRQLVAQHEATIKRLSPLTQALIEARGALYALGDEFHAEKADAALAKARK